MPDSTELTLSGKLFWRKVKFWVLINIQQLPITTLHVDTDNFLYDFKSRDISAQGFLCMMSWLLCMYHYFFVLIFDPCQHIYWFIPSILTQSFLKVPPFYILLIPFMLLKLWNSSTSTVTTESPRVASQFSRECYSSTPREVTKVWNICTKVKPRIFRQCLFCRTGQVCLVITI